MHFLELENVSIDIPVYDVSKSFRKSLLHYCVGGNIKQNNHSRRVSVRALENISFRLEKGDRLGLIGHNGAGKTTLLRVLAQVYRPSYGKMKILGKITSLLSTTIGIEFENTGYENISSVGTYLGMTFQEIQQQKESIIEFSGLGDFIHLPVKTYSSGMILRLTFSIATSLKPEILLMDESMGVGDANFSEQAHKRLEEFYANLDILVFASHSDALIRKLCNKAILLEHGKIICRGGVEEVLSVYHQQR